MKNWLNGLSKIQKISGALIFALSIGFLFRLENTYQGGCIVEYEPVFDISNIILSGISLTLISISLFSTNRHVVRGVLIFEFVYFYVKLIFAKGGYHVGFGSVADPIVFLYDWVTAFLRIWLLFHVFAVPNKKIILSIVLSLLMPLSKVYVPFYKVEGYINQIKIDHRREDIKGEWKGELYYSDSLSVAHPIELLITSDRFFFYPNEFLDYEYRVHWYDKNTGDLYSEGLLSRRPKIDFEHPILLINAIDSVNLNLTITGTLDLGSYRGYKVVVLELHRVGNNEGS